MSNYLFGEGAVVWAKYDTYPHWPARIAHKHEEKDNPNTIENDGDEDKILVFFFGSLNYGWVLPSMIEDFKKKYETYYKKSKKNDFKVGIDQAQAYLRSSQQTTTQSHPQKRRIVDNDDNAKPSTKKKDKGESSIKRRDTGESPSIKKKDIGESPSINKKDTRESSIKKKDYGESSIKRRDSGESPSIKKKDNGESPSIKKKDIGESPSIKKKDYGESSIKKKDIVEPSTNKKQKTLARKSTSEPIKNTPKRPIVTSTKNTTQKKKDDPKIIEDSQPTSSSENEKPIRSPYFKPKTDVKSKITPSKSVTSDHSDSDIEEKTPKTPLTTPTTDKNKEKSTTKKSPTEKSRNYSSDESEEEEEKNSKDSSRTPTVKKKELTPKTPISQKKWNYDVHSEENEDEEKKTPKISEKTPNTVKAKSIRPTPEKTGLNLSLSEKSDEKKSDGKIIQSSENTTTTPTNNSKQAEPANNSKLSQKITTNITNNIKLSEKITTNTLKDNKKTTEKISAGTYSSDSDEEKTSNKNKHSIVKDKIEKNSVELKSYDSYEKDNDHTKSFDHSETTPITATDKEKPTADDSGWVATQRYNSDEENDLLGKAMKQQMKMLDNACDTVERPEGTSFSPSIPEKNTGEPRPSTVFPTTSTTPNRKRPVDSSDEEEDRLEEEDHGINDNVVDLREGWKQPKAPEVVMIDASQDPPNDAISPTIVVSPSTVLAETHTNITTETKLWERPQRKRSRDNQGEDQVKSSKRQKTNDDLKNSNKLSKSSNISPPIASPLFNSTPLETELSLKMDRNLKSFKHELTQMRQQNEKSMRQQLNKFNNMLQEALHQQNQKYLREGEEKDQALKQKMQKVLKDQKMQIEAILKKQRTIVDGSIGENREKQQELENKMMDVRTAVEGLKRREKEWVGATARHYEEMARMFHKMQKMAEEEDEEVSGRTPSGTPGSIASSRLDDDNLLDLKID